MLPLPINCASTSRAELSAGDVDVYRFAAPSLTGSFRVLLERAGSSLLTPKVTLMDAAGKVVGTAASTDVNGGDLELPGSEQELSRTRDEYIREYIA